MRPILFGALLGIMFLGLTNCSLTGGPGEPCNSNGTCNGGLVCSKSSLYVDSYFCGLSADVAPKEKRRCSFESECYCVTCAEQCGARGLKTCNFSDTTTWGNKTPAVCECNAL